MAKQTEMAVHRGFEKNGISLTFCIKKKFWTVWTETANL